MSEQTGRPSAGTAHPQVLGSRYRLDAPIAVGGMGEVWRAVDERLGRPVAVKVLKPELAGDPSFRDRFRAEGRHAALLSHPGIASVFDYGEAGGSAYLVMELVDGEPLSHVIAREGRLPVVRTLDIVGQAALALQAAHDAGVVHRDVKPGNLLLRPDGVVKVTDFGIARAADAVPLTQTGAVVGTAHYLSPEQASAEPVTPRSDIYSLAVVAYECLAGRRPFDGDNTFAVAAAHVQQAPPPLPDDVPGPVRVLVEQALEKDPARRPGSAGGFGRTALALRATMTEAPPAAPFPAEPPPAARLAPTRTFAPAAPASEPAPAATAPAPPAHRRGRIAFATLIALGLLGALLAALVSRGPDPGTGRASRPGAGATARTVSVVAARYVGTPVAQARQRLRALGLTVQVAYVASGAKPGSVAAVRPTGAVPAGGTVTLSAVRVATQPARSPAPEPAHHGKGNGHGKGKGGKGGDD
ncbi:MAG: protein kinase domain-containing protein [Frankiaceae bacterium]